MATDDFQGVPPLARTSTYRGAVGFVVARSYSYLWIVLLPAAAECTASVWFPSIALGALDLQLAALNVVGALLEGFFAAWERGDARATGPVGEVCAFIADDFRGSFLSTFTSWAGMVGFAATLAHENGSVLSGVLYLVGCVAAGFIAHVVGRVAAASIFWSEGAPRAPRGDFTSSIGHHLLLGGLCAYIAATYALIDVGSASYENAFVDDDAQELPALIAAFDTGEHRLLVAMTMAILGAATGNAVGNAVDEVLAKDGDDVRRGTLVCNGLFALLGLSLNAATIRRAAWQRSVVLQSFAGSFCGAASAFAGHSSDAFGLLRDGGARAALKNAAANLGLALAVFALGLELERLLGHGAALDANANGYIEAAELGAYYGLSPPPPPPCKAPFMLLGIPIGGPRCF